MKRRIAVTGSSGFIGQSLTAALRAKGDEVAAIARPFDPARIAAQLTGADAIVHLAGLVSAPRDEDFIVANVESTRAVADGARRAGVRMGWMVLRPCVVYGPRDRAMLALFRFAAGGVLPLVGRQTAAYSFVHVDDLVRAIDRAIDADLHGETMFVAHERPATARALLETIRAAVGRRGTIVPVPNAVLRAASAAGDLAGRLRGRRMLLNSARYRELVAEGFVCRVDRLRERLGIVAEIDLADGLARTAAWYRSEGWLA